MTKLTFGWTNDTLASTWASWPKAAGTKPTVDELTRAGGMIKRQGTGKHLALAMYLRTGGATQPEVVVATGDTQVNAYREALLTTGITSRGVDGRSGHKAYALALPTARKAKAKADTAATKPTRAKAARKAARKPKAATPTTDAAS